MGKLADEIDELYNLVDNKDYREFIDEFIRSFLKIFYICEKLYEVATPGIKSIHDDPEDKYPDTAKGYVIKSFFGSITMVMQFSDEIIIESNDNVKLVYKGNDFDKAIIDFSYNLKSEELESIYKVIFDAYYSIIKGNVEKRYGKING